MSLKQFFALGCLLLVALYFAKNIQVSVTGAEAVLEDSSVEVEESSDIESDRKPMSHNGVHSPETTSDQTSDEFDPLKHMVSLIRNQQLCEFQAFVQKNHFGKYEQWQALEESFSDPEIKELTVFLEADTSNIEAYQTEAAKFFLLGQSVGAFNRAAEPEMLSYEEGFEAGDQDKWNEIHRVQSINPKNLLYTMSKHNILRKYSHRSKEIDEEVFNDLMGAETFDNPIHSLLEKIYNKAKENVAQFYLAQEILEKKVSLDRNFAMGLIWYYYSEETRAHVNQIMKEYLDRNSDSSEIFGYEPNLFELYRYSAYSELFLSLPSKEDYERSRDQPVYSLAELKIDLDQGCDQDQVDQLAIKLRSL